MMGKTLVLLLAFTAAAQADSLTTTLTGDFRPENPDNLFVHVTVEWVAGSNEALWRVDIDSPAHPDVKLDAFFFNLNLGGDSVAFSVFAPNTGSGATWSGGPGGNAPGSGSADFDFGVDQTGGGSPQPNEVNNAVDLTFKLTLGSGTWNEDILKTAALSDGGGIPPPGAQMGAHLQSLVPIAEGYSDSGFASGNWEGADPIPEPSVLALALSAVAAGFFLRRRR